MRKILYWFTVVFIVSMMLGNLGMIVNSCVNDQAWAAPLFLMFFSLWMYELYVWLRDFKYLKQ